MKWPEMFRKRAEKSEFTKSELEAIFELHENNPLAGLGDNSVRDRIIDDILGYGRMCIAKAKGVTPRQPEAAIRAPLPTEVPLDLRAASLAKSAGM
jgi:hypothetical protein